MVYKKHTSEVKWLVLRALDAGKPMKDIIRDFDVSERSVQRWQAKLDQEGTFAYPTSVVGRPRILSEILLAELAALMDESPSQFIAEIQDYLCIMNDQPISTSTLARNLKDIGYERKVLRKVATQQDPVLRGAWMEHMLSHFGADQLVFTDESSKDGRTLARRYGRAPKGRTPVETVTFDRGQRWSILPALTLDGYIALRVVEGSVDGEEFFDFIVNDVLPKMNAFPASSSVLVMDNCNIHKSRAVRDACEDHGVILVFLPPYSPDFNPIEESFSCVKMYLRRHWRHFEYSDFPDVDLYEACFSAVSSLNAPGWFRHSGYK